MVVKLTNFWQKTRTGLMIGAACVLSPCCTPLIVPILLSLIVGTPAATWIAANLGWVYGGLTALSVISLVIGLYWMGKKQLTSKQAAMQAKLDIPLRDLMNAPQHD